MDRKGDFMDMKPLINYLLDDVGISKKKVSQLLHVDSKTVTNMSENPNGYAVVKIPVDRAIRAGTHLEECI